MEVKRGQNRGSSIRDAKGWGIKSSATSLEFIVSQANLSSKSHASSQHGSYSSHAGAYVQNFAILQAITTMN